MDTYEGREDLNLEQLKIYLFNSKNALANILELVIGVSPPVIVAFTDQLINKPLSF